MTILSKKKTNAPKDRTRETVPGQEVDVVHHGVVQNEHSSGNIALPNSPYQVSQETEVSVLPPILPSSPPHERASRSETDSKMEILQTPLTRCAVLTASPSTYTESKPIMHLVL